jgi:NAD-dependent dihydropyrimidine dehydrogenase PreA subunit
MNLDTLTRLTERFTNEQLLLNADRCLNARFKKAGCHICMEACPAEAIQIEGRQVLLDLDACTRCGACVWQCPTEVFVQPRAAQSKLIEAICSVGAAPIDLRCPQNVGDTTTIAAATIVQYSQCLATLSPAKLIELAAERHVWLNDEKCAACPLSKAQPSITRAVNDANRWRAAFDRPRRIHQQSTDGVTTAQPHAAPIVDSANPLTDRRAFFNFFKKALAETGSAAVSDQMSSDDQPAPVSQRLPQHLPHERQNLLAALGRLGQPQDVPLDLPCVQIDAADCTACGLCAKFCPTSAIRFQADGTHFDLSFIPAACVDCNICVRACPTQAVSLTHDLAPSQFMRLTATLLLEGDLTPCAVCKKPTAARADRSPRCEVCRVAVDQQTLAADLFSSFHRSS